MRARDLMEDFPLVDKQTDALEATRLLVDRGLPGLVVLDAEGVPLVVLPGSQVLRFALPEYVEDDPTLAAVFPEAEADRLCDKLSGRTVAQLMPGPAYLPQRDRDRPIVAPGATAMQVASVMSRQHSPIVAVVQDHKVLGVITVHRLLGALLPAAVTDPGPWVVAAAITVFVGAYVLIATEWVHRVRAALGGAAVMFLIGATTGDEAFFSAETGIDWNVILLLFGMMVVISVVKQTGLFEYLAIWAGKRAKGRPYRLLVLLCLITAIASAMLDNVTTVLLIAPVTLLVCSRLGVRPELFLVAMAMASNIGGVGTLVGDPPNIIIGSRAGLSFNDFLLNLAPLAVLLVAVFLLLARFLFRSAFVVDPEVAEDVAALDERQAIRNPALLRRVLAVLAAILSAFALHSVLGLDPSVVALLGAGAMVLVSRTSRAEFLEDVEWETLVFFIGLFVMVGALVNIGVIDWLGEKAIDAVGGQFLLAATVLLFGSAVISGVIDNIPYVATLTPLVADLVASGTGPEAMSLWWALALGAGLGGNATAIGASANVVVTGIAAREGHPISFGTFTRYGIVVTTVTVLIAWPYLWLRYFVLT